MIKKIEAAIRPDKMNQVMQALIDEGAIGVTAIEVKGRGREGGMELQWRTGTYLVHLLPRILISIVCNEDDVERNVEAIRKAAFTGQKGDGIIFVSPVESVIRISTGEEDTDALSYASENGVAG
ncbi:MAG: P-II family nitrogen regulator [Anaerolineaceae bacterium]|nr:P-II family nitrogen regulator [Anaerolineaceae bacterium]MCY4008844.1 P-II family nitrogen regulator [Anaerolineaceae bacterium]